MKKRVIQILLFVWIALGTAACGGTEGGLNDPGGKNVLIFSTHMGEHPGWLPAYDAIITRYEELHPGVDIRLHYQPLDGMQIWLETQFISGRGPDIINSGNHLVLGAQLGMLVPMSEYIAQESAYLPGKPWRDTFYPIVWKDTEDPIYGEIWTVPFNFFTLRMFYNIDLFEQVGIYDPPKTWTEFIDIQRRLKDAGIVPFLMSNSLTNAYAGDGLARLCEMVLQDRVPELDHVNPDGKVDPIEQNIGIYRGDISLDDVQARVVLRLLKEWSQYWVPGFNGLDRQQAKMLFANGMGAMYNDGSWETEGILQAVNFRCGVFSAPTVTVETTPYADGPRNDNNFNLTFMISTIAKKRGRLPLAMDFLQYLTGPEAADTLSKYVAFISSLRDYPVPEQLKAFAPDTGHKFGVNPWAVASQLGSLEAGDKLTNLIQGYLADEITEQELVDQYRPMYQRLAISEMGYALQENRKRMLDTGQRLNDTLVRLDSLRSLADSTPIEREITILQRRADWLEVSHAKARRQYEALDETLSQPPVWEIIPNE
jgi:raffinose/stachyose/melibiose transport system substrate-binding protein